MVAEAGLEAQSSQRAELLSQQHEWGESQRGVLCGCAIAGTDASHTSGISEELILQVQNGLST